ncbi:hypothetical protein FE257_011302 [Aspergillus nanangensis]|uniref:Protein kinase domain-containing protein n=1 Tax=Aspergillus nanangensis TaxID=2582783 RepID=A0AAD4CHF3_ASPNN|nr:hypothetical protein FE257_011302 [Aspergillus nanangensis]
MHLYPQTELEVIGSSASGQIYQVDDSIALKSGRIFTPPPSSASSQDQWFYASETLFHANLIKNEQFILQLLQQHPHPNIIDIIDAHHPEGIYFRRHLSRSELSIPPTTTTTTSPTSKTKHHTQRIHWYRDITNALLHLHRLHIAHSDLRIDNVLFDARGSAYLYDFSSSAPFGEDPHHTVVSDTLVSAHGLSTTTISDATDRFAMGTLIFHMEHGAKPCFAVDPEVKEEEERGCVLHGLLSEARLQDLADQYGWNKDGDLRFTNYTLPACYG